MAEAGRVEEFHRAADLANSELQEVRANCARLAEERDSVVKVGFYN